MHGTLNGYRAHRKLGLEPCEPCRRAYERLYGPDAPRADGQPIKAWHPDQTAAFERDRARVQPQRDRWTQHRRERRPEGKYCGTAYGYTCHVREGSPKCQPCRDAHAAYERDRLRRSRPA